MKKFTGLLISLPVLLLMAVAGCSLDAPDDPSAGINPPTLEDAGARYVAVGNSLTAGFMDGGLMMAGQASSYPQLIAAQLGLSRTQFTQPWIAAPGLGSSTPSSPANVAGVLYFDGAGIEILGETPLASVQSTLLLAVSQPTQYHNLGVPGATLHDGMNAYSAATSAGAALGSPNPFFDFINRAAFFGNKAIAAGYPDGMGGLVPVTYQSASQFYQAIAKGGALVTLWLGNNDVLGPATSGEPPAGFGAAGAAAFQADYTALLAMLAGGLAQRNGFPATIVVANIPSVSSTPYFIPEAVFDAYVRSQLGQSWPGGYAEGTVDYVRFPALSWLAAHAVPDSFGVALPANLTLDHAEAVDVATAVGTYNAIIAGVAASVNASGVARVGLMDANALLAGRSAAEKTHFLFLVGQGMSVATAASTTIFSLDGIHPNSHGYGIVANAFIDEINDLDGTSIAHVDPDALTWDPTYGMDKSAGSGPLRLDPAAAAAMDAIFR